MSRLRLLDLAEPSNGIILGLVRLDHDTIEDEVMLSDGTIRNGFINSSIRYLIMTLNTFYPDFVVSSRAIVNEDENVIYIEIRSWEKPDHHKIYDFIEYYNERLIDLRMYIYLERFIEETPLKLLKSRRQSPKSKKPKIRRG